MPKDKEPEGGNATDARWEKVFDSFISAKKPADRPNSPFTEPFTNDDFGGMVCVNFAPHNLSKGDSPGYYRGVILHAVDGPDPTKDVNTHIFPR